MSTLRDLRRAQGILTSEEFAVRLHLSIATLKKAEAGRRVSRNTALRIAEFLQLPPHDISDLLYEGKEVDVLNVQPRDS